MNWTFPALQYEALWFARDRDRMHYPFAIRPDYTDDDDLRRRRHAAVDKVRERLSDELVVAISVLDRPQVRIESHARVGPDESTVLRLYVGIVDRLGVIAVQQPGPDPEYGGDVSVHAVPVVEVPKLVYSALPKTPPGQHNLRVRREDLHNGVDLSPNVADVHHRKPAPGEQIIALFGRPRLAWGQVDVYAGPALDNSYDGADGFTWIDVAEDGRYYVDDHPKGLSAQSLDAPKFATTLNHRIGKAKQR